MTEHLSIIKGVKCHCGDVASTLRRCRCGAVIGRCGGHDKNMDREVKEHCK